MCRTSIMARSTIAERFHKPEECRRCRSGKSLIGQRSTKRFVMRWLQLSKTMLDSTRVDLLPFSISSLYPFTLSISNPRPDISHYSSTFNSCYSRSLTPSPSLWLSAGIWWAPRMMIQLRLQTTLKIKTQPDIKRLELIFNLKEK